MSNRLFTQLEWLPRTSADLFARCKSLFDLPEEGGVELRALASCFLDENGLARVARTIGKLRAAGRPLQPLTPFRLGVLSNSTTDFVVSAITATAPRFGLIVECVQPDYSQVMQAALDPGSQVNRERPDAVLMALDHRALPIKCALGSASESAAAVKSCLDYLYAVRSGLKAANPNVVCVVQTVPPPPERLFGSLDRQLAGTLRNLIERLNSGIAEALANTGDVILDIAGLAETVGLAEWHCPTQWNIGKLAFSSVFLPLYADYVCRILAALRGKSRRCLVLDLDNTLWGGVIGDDGLEGIQCAQGDPTGEAYLSVQRLALDLRDRGVVLAVSSKNDDEIARQPFRRHPEMLLREEHIAVFQANWNDKAANIQAIAEELSLGLEAFVLLDDNPAERDLVRRLLPEVAVPELPDDPALYARTLTAAGYFESLAFSEEDVHRAVFYRDNARRVELREQAGDVEAYLASLEMEITFQPFDATGRARIAQLINKSNQFNLTTRRYNEIDVAAMERDPEYFTLQIRLCDKLGDNGMISVVICHQTAPERWEIDTWLMSCRVLGRRVEQMVLRELVTHAGALGITTIAGRYIPTERNRLVEDHYQKLGFKLIGAQEDGSTVWELDVPDAEIEPAPMLVRSVGFDAVRAQAASC